MRYPVVLKLSQVDLNLLVALDALLRERNVTQAGREIGLSQPAMSAALAKLRELFSDKLFERVAGSYRLTPLAETLAEPLQAALQAVQRTLDHNTDFEPQTSRRAFRLAVSDHLLVVLCPRLVERIHRLAPSIQLHTQPVTPDIGALLGARKVDLSIQPANLVRGCESKVLFEDEWVCAAWKGNDAVKDGLTSEQLYTLPHASFAASRVSLAEQMIVPPLAKTPVVRMTTRTFASLPFLLQGTPLIGILQRSLGERMQSVADIRVLDLPIPTPALLFEMSWNAIYSADPAHAWLRERVAEVAEGLTGKR